MFSEKFAGRVQEHNRAVERAAIAFDDADDKRYAVVARDFAQHVDGGTRDVDRRSVVQSELVAPFWCPQPDRGAETCAPRIAANESLWKQNYLRVHAGGIGGQRPNLLQRLLGVEINRGRLYARRDERVDFGSGRNGPAVGELIRLHNDHLSTTEDMMRTVFALSGRGGILIPRAHAGRPAIVFTHLDR
jgi:hypothetical protein